MRDIVDLQNLKGKLIVSCQAFPGEALYGSDLMAKMALAAKDGGASGIRANSPEDIVAIRNAVDLPIVGLWKRTYSDSEVYITPTFADVAEVVKAGASIVAMDATLRSRPNGEKLQDIILQAKSSFSCLFMADISTVEEGVHAYQLGFDIISTTLSGYTSYSGHSDGPDLGLVEELVKRIPVPVFAEGRIHTADQAVQLLEKGAYAIVIGGAITRPQMITKSFVDKMSGIEHPIP